MKTFTKKEVIWIVVAIILFTLIIGINYNTEEEKLQLNLKPRFLLIAAIIIIVNISAKEFAAPRYSAKIEHKIWSFQRWGFYKRAYLKKPIPMGLIFPPILSFLTLGFLKPMVFLQYEAKNDPSKRILKKQGTRRAERKSELNEVDMAFISVYGFYSLILLAIVASILSSFFNIPLASTIAKYAIFYGAWNLIPFGHLDGAKTFYGSLVSYSILLIVYIIALLLALIL